MTRRYHGAGTVLLIMLLTAGLSGCAAYRAKSAFQEAEELARAEQYDQAVEKYFEATQSDPGQLYLQAQADRRADPGRCRPYPQGAGVGQGRPDRPGLGRVPSGPRLRPESRGGGPRGTPAAGQGARPHPGRGWLCQVSGKGLSGGPPDRQRGAAARTAERPRPGAPEAARFPAQCGGHGRRRTGYRLRRAPDPALQADQHQGSDQCARQALRNQFHRRRGAEEQDDHRAAGKGDLLPGDGTAPADGRGREEGAQRQDHPHLPATPRTRRSSTRTR